MTPNEMIEHANPPPVGDADGLAALITACGRDERPALKALYKLTASALYGRAIAATNSRAQAEQALVQTYLAVFAEAELFDASTSDPAAWLQAMLDRHLPAMPGPTHASAAAAAPVEPPAELWQKLDIALGLKRLDRHIKPGVATQPRGRDPMPDAHDRRIERQLRIWRVTGVSSLLAFALATAVIAGMTLKGGPLDSSESNAASLAEASAAIAASAAAIEPSRLAILRATEEGRVWRVDLEGPTLRVRALPPFTRTDNGGRQGVLALWAGIEPATKPNVTTGAGRDGEPGAAENNPLLRLADLDPATSNTIALPDDLAAADLEDGGIAFVISLEPSGVEPAAAPAGPVLFSGRLEP